MKRGRKPKVAMPGTTARIASGLYISADLKNKIDAAAALNGRTQAKEIAQRVERSFRDDEVLSELRLIRALLEGVGR